MATLSIWNYFQLDSQGSEKTGKHGTATDAPQAPFDITVTGTCLDDTGSLATAMVRTVYDSTAQFPATFNYLFLWADQNLYLQLIGAASNVKLPVLAKTPFVLAPLTTSTLGILAAANTTPISGGSEPTLTLLTKIVIGNYSGSTANYRFALVD